MPGGVNSISLAGDTLYFHALYGSLHAVEAGSGRGLWEFKTGSGSQEDGAYYSPALDGGALYFVSSQVLYAVR